MPKCKCFTGCSGDECEMASTFAKIVRPTVQFKTSPICFTITGFVISVFVLNDVCNYFLGKSNKLENKKKKF